MEFKKRRGQFALIASFLVVMVLLSAINLSYTRIQNSQNDEPVSILNPTQRINKAIENILAFSVSYYASILNVTGDYNYAQQATKDYLSGGFNKLAHSEANSNPSFEIDTTFFKINWYKKQSYSNGTITISYDLPSIGLKGVKYSYAASLKVNTKKIEDGRLIIHVYGDGLTDLSLVEDNFRFMIYNSQRRAWEYVYIKEVDILADGSYSILIPGEISQKLCFLEVRDNRGIIVKTIYLKDVGSGDSQDYIAYKFNLQWNNTAYPSQMKNDYFPLEYLQNGTLRYLGQSLNKGNEKIMPQIPVRLLRVNQTINSMNRECMFQVEDWNTDYMVPLGITSNNTLFSEANMMVFLVNHNVSDVTIWWEDDDSKNQTKLAYENKYFKNDDINNNVLISDVNGTPFKLDFKQWNAPNYYFTADYNAVIVDSYLGLTNSTSPVFPAKLTYAVSKGIVRDIVMQTAVVDTSDNSVPTIYYNYVITLPANCTYYTYQITNTMLSTDSTRRINDLSFIKLKIAQNDQKYVMIDLDNNFMEVANPTTFPWVHKGVDRWIEYMSVSGLTYRGAGILMMQESVNRIFKFDQDISPNSTGRVNILNNYLLLSPVLDLPLNNYQNFSQVTWYGAVMLFDSTSAYDTIYYKNASNQIQGLYSMVVYPPTIS